MKQLSIKMVSPAEQQPVSPAPSAPSASVRIVTPRARSATSLWLLRSALLLAIIGSALLIYWSYAKRLQPVTTEQREKTSQMSRLADEIEQLRLKWTPQQIEKTKADYSDAKSVLFKDEEEIDGFKTRVHSHASMRVLNLIQDSADVSPHPALTNEVSILPMNLEVEPLPILVTTNTPYSRVLSFAEGVMARSEKRFELVSLTVAGNSNSVSRAVAVVNLFTFPKSP